MSYRNSPCKRSFRLSTPVRLGVAAVAACFISAPVLSLPVNPTVINGTAAFNQAGNVLTVTNSNGAIINWQKFSIGAGETTHFAQASASSSVLNRVLNDPTAIYGTLSSNGRVWLVNPAGIMVGPGGKVDVAGFVASTLNIRNEDFLAGRNVFVNDSSAKNVINQGEIRTPAGGSVYLIGSNVTNEGIITTPKGETILAAGATVSLIDSATPGVKVDITGSEGNATNLGTITAEAGRIGIAGVIVRNSGMLNASSVVSEGGRVFLKASRDAYVDGNGRIVTTGTRGGRVEVLGDTVAVTDNAVIDASGANGGGVVLVGGDYQGRNPGVQNASTSYFGAQAAIKADATDNGDGGKVIIWANDTTRAYGDISARGGANGGDGGFVEVSGRQSLDFAARVNTLAPYGKTGTLLLDPGSLFIDDTIWASFYQGLGTDLILQTDSSGTGNIDFSGSGAFNTFGHNLKVLAYGVGASTGHITFTDFRLDVAGDLTLTAGWDGVSTVTPASVPTKGNIVMSGVTKGTWIQAASMNVQAGNNLTLTGGGGSGTGFGPGNSGPGVMLYSTGAQTVTAGSQILLTAGSFDNTAHSGSSHYGGSVAIVANGNQTITAPTIKLAAGTAGHDNAAEIRGGGVTQDINVTSLLELKGGGGGDDNYAWIDANGFATDQTINAGGANIILTGGTSGGTSNRENSADISLNDMSNSGGSQTVHAGNITINGGSAAYGGAGFGTGYGLDQTFHVSGNLIMTGGSTNNADFVATPVYIGSEFGGGTKNLYVGGNITLNGGTGTGGGVLIGSLENSDGDSTVNIFAGGNINATANTGGVWLGVVSPTGGYKTDLNLIAGWNGSTVSPDVGSGPGAINASGVGVTARTVGGAFTALAYGSVALGTINTDAWSSGSNGGDVYIKAFNDTLNVASISAQGAWGGGNGGAVTLWAQNDLTVGTGGINANGGGGYSGGNGGNGGEVMITSQAGKIAVNGDINSNGGWGGDGGEGNSGGNGGNGGNITLNSGTFISLAASKTISSVGGGGGWGGDGGEGGTGGNGGTGGTGGTIALTSGTYISLGANSQIHARGGDGGEGGRGGEGYGSGYSGGNGGNGGGGGTITLTATAGNIGLTSGGVRLDTGGGQGGQGGTGGYGYNSSDNAYGAPGGTGGQGGSGGSFALNAVAGSILLGNANLNANGGSGGSGGTGGYGYSFGYAGFGGTGGTGGQGGGGGSISLSALTIQTGSGALDASGGTGGTGGTGGYGYGRYDDGFGGNGGTGGGGGSGGSVTLISGAGGISMDGGGILARGGNGGEGGAAGLGGSYSYYGYAGVKGLGGNGADAGSISLTSGGIISLTNNSSLNAGGGDGGGYDWANNRGNGGDGGEGGGIVVQGASIVASGASFQAQGGNAGRGDAFFGTTGGTGGDGGYVVLVANSGSISLTNVYVGAGGGNGGWGADSAYIPGRDGYGTTSGGNGGNGGFVYGYASGAVQLTSSTITTSGGGGGNGGNDLIGYYDGESESYPGGGTGGNGGNGGQIGINGGSIAMTGSSVQANGGWGGWGGDGFGSTAVNTVVDGWGVEICGGSSGITCDGTQTLDSHGVLLAFHPADGAGPATVGGSGGAGGNVYDGTAIYMNAFPGNISMSSDSTIYASPGGGGQGGLGWADGSVAFYYPTYPSSWVQFISWSGISHDFYNWEANGSNGTPGTVSLTASGSVGLGRVEAWDGTVNVTAGGAILDNNGSGSANIVAQHATLISTNGGAAGELAISAGTEVYGNLVATVSGGAYGGIDIANTSWNQQPVSVNLTDNATSGSAVFRQKFTSSTATLYGAGITLIAQPGGFVGLSSNRDLTFDGGGFFSAGGGGIIGFAANNGTLNIDSALAGGTDSVELSAGTMNISEAVSGANITLDGTTTNVNAATTATGYLDIFGGTLNVNAAMQGQDVLLGVGALNVGGSGGIHALNSLVGVVTGDANITGGYLKTTNSDLELLVGGNLNIAYGGMIYAGFGLPPGQPSPFYYPDASIAVGGNLRLTNGGYIAAANDIYLDMLGSGSTVELSSDGGSPAYILADIGTGVPSTIYLDFLTRSSGGIMIDGTATTTSSPGESGFFVVDHDTPATEADKTLVIKYASTGGVDPCVNSPDLCKPPLPVMDMMENGADPCASDPDSAQCKALKDEKEKAENDGFGDGESNGKSSKKKVAQCSV